MKQFKMNERQRFSIRKFSIGAASVLLGSVFFVANPATEVQAAESSTEVVAQDRDVKPDNSSALSSSETSSQNPSVGQAGTEAETQGREKKEPGTLSKDGEAKAKVEERSTEGNSKLESNKEIAEKQDQPKTDIELSRQLNTQNLESLLSEIDAIKTENYTKESVAALKAKAEEARQVLTTAQNQTEIDAAFRTLVSYKNTGLKRVKNDIAPKAPKLDTTNGKATVGLKAENTEPNATNIAGHNHSLNGTTFTEGSGFRGSTDASGFSYELSGADLSSLVAGEELGYGKKVIIKVKYDTNAISYRDIGLGTTPNVGPSVQYTRKASDGVGPFEGGLNLKLVGRIPNDMIGTYDLHLHILNNKNSNSERATLKIPITVKPNKPTVRVEDLAHAEGRKPVVTANVANATVSKAEFYLNNVKQATVEAANGTATWTPTAPLKENDQITVKNIAKGGIPPVDAYGNTFTVNEVESVMSDAVTIPKAPTPTLNKDGAKNEVETAFSTKSTQIDNDNGLTTEEKTEVKGLAKTAKDNAIQNIENAQDETTLNTAKTDGINSINNVAVPTGEATEKGKAIKAVEDALKEKDKAVDGNAGLTTEEKAEVKKQTEQAKTTAVTNINNATTNATVGTAKTDGINSINNVAVPTGEATEKGKAIKAIEAVAFAKKTEISNRFDLTTEDKSRALQQVDQEAKDAKIAVDKGVTNKDVEQAKVAGIDAIKNINPQPSPRPLPTPQPQPSTPTQTDQGGTETPTAPSEPAPQPSQPIAPSQPANPAPAPSSAPTQAPRVAASPSASSTSTQAPAQEQVDKSELRALTQELDQRLKALATVSDPKIDAAKAVLLDAQKALEDSALTEQGLRTAVESVKAALDSLKDVKANASDSKPTQDKKDAKQGTEDSKDSDKMTETNSVPAGVIVVGLLALLGVIAFWLVRRKKESEIQQLSTELTKVLGQLDAEKADKKVLAKAKKLLQETLDFVKEENGSAETEAKLVEELKAILAKLK